MAPIHFGEFLAFLRNLPRRQPTLLVGIDGCGGSGKSSFARKLASQGPDITIVEVDDFYRPTAHRSNPRQSRPCIACDLDWGRLKEQVLEPLRAGRAGHYQRYDWSTDELAEFHGVPTGGIVLIEGVYSLLPDIRGYYDYRVWVEAPYEVRLTRGLERDGEESRERWVHEWMPAEQSYVDTCQPEREADMRVDSSGDTSNDPATHFVGSMQRH